MRTYDELCEAIASCKIPYARIAFDTDDPDELQAPPYVLLMPRGTNNFMAGNKIVLHITSYDVELYVDGSSTALEATVEAALDAGGFTYQRDTVTLDDGMVELIWKGSDCKDD